MDDYERTFLAKTVRLSRSGVNFEDLAREALSSKFGGATDVLLHGLSPEVLADPNMLVKAMTKMFGRGALGIYEPIVKYVDLGLYGTKGFSPVLELIRQLGPAALTDEERELIPLHDQRIEDEHGDYADDSV